jgi:hypothetical protein
VVELVLLLRVAEPLPQLLVSILVLVLPLLVGLGTLTSFETTLNSNNFAK